MENKATYYRRIPLDLIKPPADRVRSQLDEYQLDDLAKSIKDVGVLEPILVIEVGDMFEVVVGDRRVIASQMAGVVDVPAIVISATEDERALYKLHENWFKEDVNIVDEAKFIKKVMDVKGLSQEGLAKFLHRSTGYISQRLAVLEYLDPLRDSLRKGQITFSVARELSHIDDIKQLRYYLYHAIRDGCSVDTARLWRTTYAKEKIEQPEGVAIPESEPPRVEPVQDVNHCMACGREFAPFALVRVPLCNQCKREIEAVREKVMSEGGSSSA